MARKVTTLVYALRDGQVALMRRRKWPNFGQWTAPGGKVELDESPQECAVRELAEETGLLAADKPELRLIVTETSPVPDEHWLMFVYLVRAVTGELAADSVEGELAWVDVDQVLALDIPQADRIFYPLVLDGTTCQRSLKFSYDAALKLVEWRIE